MLDMTNLNALFSLESALPPPSVSPAPSASALEFLQGIHRRNTEMLRSIVSEQGWPLPTAQGENPSSAAFIIALHSDYDMPFQRLCHGLMLAGAKLGQVPLGFVAFITDRILANSGHHQRFGTQIREVHNGCFVPKPMEDPENIDILREHVGLGETLSEYFQRVNDGDLLLYRRLLGHYAEELEEIRANKVVPLRPPTKE